MAGPQRWWLFGVLITLAMGLMVYHLEWMGYDQNDSTEERLALPVYRTTRPHIIAVDEPQLGLKVGDKIELVVQHGLYVRRTRPITQSLLLGGLVPLALLGTAGFLILGSARHDARDAKTGLSLWQRYKVKRSLARALNTNSSSGHNDARLARSAPLQPTAIARSRWWPGTLGLIGFLVIASLAGGIGKFFGRKMMDQINTPSRAQKEAALAESAINLRQTLPKKVGNGVTLVDAKTEGLTLKYIHEIVNYYGKDEINAFEIYARQTLCSKKNIANLIKQGVIYSYEYWSNEPAKILKGQYLINSCP